MIYIVPECNLPPPPQTPKHVARGNFCAYGGPSSCFCLGKGGGKGQSGLEGQTEKENRRITHANISVLPRMQDPEREETLPPLYIQLHSMRVWIQATAWCHHHDNIIWKKKKGGSPSLTWNTQTPPSSALASGLIDRLSSPEAWQTAPWWDRETDMQAVRQTDGQAGRQAGKHVLRQGRHTLNILASRLYCSPLHGEVLESLVLQVWRITGTSLLLSDTFEMWLYKVIARDSGRLRKRHKAALQLLWVDMVSAINWNVRHF